VTRLTARNLPPFRYILLTVFTVLAVIYMISPIVIIVLNSFSSVAYNVFPPEGLSLRWYVKLIEQGDFFPAAVRSIVLATLATAIAMVIGTMASYALVKYAIRGGDFIKGFLLSPVVLPKIVIGAAVFMFVVQIRMSGNYSSLLLTHVLVVFPFVLALISASLANFDWSQQEAAMDLGAGPIQTFFRVVLPQIWVGMAVAALFAFFISFDQVEVTLFLARPGVSTLPVEMFLFLQKWQDPTIAALSTVIVAFVAVVLFALGIILRGVRLVELLQRKDSP
jgi:putative spermidine/putrescine transport system permease protein